MQPIHSLEYDLTTELATQVQQTLARWELRRGWRRDVRVLAGAGVFAALIIWLGLEGWIAPTVGGGLMCLLMLFALVAVFRRWAMARGAAWTVLLALQTSDRRVRIEFGEERLRMETELFRGEGAWTELEEVVVFSSFWMLRLSNGGQILLPGSAVSSELEAFLRAKALQVMVPIRQE
jgi:hypothetical protein